MSTAGSAEPRLRLVFAGTPEFALPSLAACVESGADVVAVYTQPDRPAGRGRRLSPSPVKQAAVAAGIPIEQPATLKAVGAQATLAALRPDLLVVVAYGLILPPAVLGLPTHGCWNVHASLLPRWRGAAPIQRAIEAGDAETGVTIMQMDEGLDTGDMLLTRTVPIGAHTAASLHDELAAVGAQAVLEAMAQCEQGALKPVPQPAEGVTYAAKLEKSEAPLDFSLSASVLARRIRAFNPVPGATVRLPGLNDVVKVWSARAIAQPAGGEPGRVLAAGPEGIDLATGEGVLRLLELQKAGGKRQAVSAFVQGWRPAF